MISFESLEQPTEYVVKNFADAFDINFYKDENELKRCFLKSVNDEGVIDSRVRTLNAQYHVHLWEKHIREIIDFLKGEGSSFEEMIHKDDPTVVKKLAERNSINCFVFATKYCSFVEQNKYPIYDSLVARVLMYFHKQRPLIDGNLNFEEIRKNADYETFKNIVDEFRRQYCLERCSYKDIDKFLWLVGKNLREK